MKTLRICGLGIWVILAALLFACDPWLAGDGPEVFSPNVTVGETSAIFTARFNPNGNATVCLKYRPSTSTAEWTVVFLQEYYRYPDTEVEIPVSGLIPGTEYEYELLITNEEKATTKDGSFSTLMVHARITEQWAADIKMNSATLCAKFIPNQENSLVSFRYAGPDGSWKTEKVSETFNGCGRCTAALTIGNLPANTVIKFCTEIDNQAGTTTGDTMEFTTAIVVDGNGNAYCAVKIGEQTWLNRNFAGTFYANGDPIPHVVDSTTWKGLKTGAYCQYNHDPEIAKIYGNLYNWYVGVDSRKLIPGWHVPTDKEWLELVDFLGGYSPAGNALREKGTSHWLESPSWITNATGFSALPSGGYYQEKDKWIFSGLGELFWTWTSVEFFGYGEGAEIYLNHGGSLLIGGLSCKEYGSALRLIKDR